MEPLFQSKEEFIDAYCSAVESDTGKDFASTRDQERFDSLCALIGARARSVRVKNNARIKRSGCKRVYYFSLEFLIGPLLENYLLNFGILDLVREALDELGSPLERLAALESDPGLGNGGLGRLAACILDSMAAQSIAGFGMGLRYRYGFFKQKIVDGRQVETMDDWLARGYPWEQRRPDSAIKVTFGGEVVRHEEGERYWFSLEGGDTVRAIPYDVPVVGYGGQCVNTLRLWSAEPITADFDLRAFNAGDYAAASKFRTDVEAITSVLYPDDSGEHGRLLRLKQEYFLVSAGIGHIMEQFKDEHGSAWDEFPHHVAIHTNDTHSALCGAELMRRLVDDEGLGWDEAWDIVTRSVSFTNHTILPEALEKWPIDVFRPLLPRIYMYIEEIDRRYRESFPKYDHDWHAQIQQTAILWDGQVRMANLSVICSHSVNGVAPIHTDILKRVVFKDFDAAFPDKISNKTNGISHRRFLGNANPSLTRLICDAIGEGWLADADELKALLPYRDDPAFLEAMSASKQVNKERLARYVKEQTGIELDSHSIFDVQVKRFHAYKRQLLNIFKVMDLYNRILEDPNHNFHPTSFIFAGKAAPSYAYAKEVIRLINSVAAVVNADPRSRDLIKVAFVPNFAVSNAELIYPAADISEQISTAGMEASGTSNMKLMMNGALTLGTLDGANIDIAELVGRENLKIFGLTVEEVEGIKQGGNYLAWDVYHADRDRLGRVVDQLVDGTYAGLSGDFPTLYDGLMYQNDADFVLKDFHSYVQAWEELVGGYEDQRSWQSRALANTANSGYFSIDRTVKEYASEIWRV